MVFYEDAGTMSTWETEDEATAVGRAAAAASLPTPVDTPYRTPSRGSRKSRRSVTPPGKRSSGTPSLTADKADRASKRSSKDFATDESISILDPRRFTPTLHANLVSEILALRRDQEEKLKAIENLEVALHASKEDQESLQESLSGTNKENRSLRRQLDLLEGGTSSAMKELARERDEAADAAAEAKKRLDASQKRLRVHEDDSRRVHSQWAQERESWDEEKRKYERKIHIAESRLKTLLEEVAQFQAAQTNGLAAGNESDTEDQGRDNNDAASVRTMSMTNSIRFSMMNGGSMGKAIGHSLADELNFDGDDATDYETDNGNGYGRESVLSNHMRNTSRESVMSKLHRRNQSNDSVMRSGSVARGRFLNQPTLERLEDVIREDGEETAAPPPPKFTYKDSAVQYSPPPSPKVKPVKPTVAEAVPAIPARASMRRDDGSESPARADGEVEANQRRKRIHVARPVPVEPVAPQIQMVSAGSQTVAEKPKPTMVSSASQTSSAATVSCSTQTDAPPPAPPVLPKPEIGLMQIPSISIHPPTSRPSTPKEPRLPQLFKDFGCQVAILSTPATSVSSTGVQTDEIRVDKRLDKLPSHLHPSAVTSRPNSPAIQDTEPDDAIKFTPVPGHLPPRNPRRLTSQRSLSDIPSSPTQAAGEAVNTDETHDAYPGNNDDGPLSSQKAPLRRPHRISSLFAGFDGNSSDEADEFADGDFSDPEFRTALSAPKPNGKGKRSSGTLSDSQLPSKQGGRNAVRSTGPHSTKLSFPDIKDRRASVQDGAPSRSHDKAPPAPNSGRFSVMRKGGMSSQQTPKSPDLSDSRDPPYPIPTRASSRRPPISASAPSDGQQSPTRGGFPGRPSRNNSVRKVRSVAALPRSHRHRKRNSRSPPPPFSPTTEDSVGSPGLPPLPHNDITTPRSNGYSSVSTRYSRSTHRHHPSNNTADTDNTTGAGSVATSGPQPGATGVVEAIAQTMVGEWMFKYVRRRKSFGPVGESQGRDDSSNDRHRRWVWLAPYERAILWSSKQPSSGSALMGKAGRKLTIQSVLDVKDDNPPPKGANGAVFSRSILILTPQRALKFTACSSERHYLWLTALSFLAHSHQAVPENLAPPSLGPKAMPDLELSQQKPRRPGIRDSIRLAKGRTAMSRGGAVTPIGSVMSAAPSSAAQNSDFGVPSLPSIPDFPGLEAIGPPTTSGGGGYYAQHQRELSRDAAEPPFIPRFNDTRISVTDRANHAVVHGRKRSNTGGHVPPPISFRGFSGPIGGGGSSNGSYHQSTNSTAGASIDTTGSSGILPSGNAGFGGSRRTSEASSRPSGATMNNFFDAIGTVRMEAFISPLAPNPSVGNSFNDYPDEHEEMRWRARRRSKEARRRTSRSRRRDSYTSRIRDDDFFRSDDPFKGF